jgi:Protein of unknown function (DUF2630)
VDGGPVVDRIEALVREENSLRGREQADSSSAEALEADRTRLEAISVELDRCWDLLRQRRALSDAGQDPDQAQARDATTVERYLQ